MISDVPNGTTVNPGYPAAWNDDDAGFAEIPDLAYVNETVTVAPGDELRAIEEIQRRGAGSVPAPAFLASLFGLRTGPCGTR